MGIELEERQVVDIPDCAIIKFKINGFIQQESHDILRSGGHLPRYNLLAIIAFGASC